MFAEVQYLTWARRFLGSTRYNLGTSGEREFHLDTRAVDLYDPSGPQRAVAAIAHHHDRPANECHLAHGASQALFLAMAAVLRPGDEVLIEAPVYQPVLRIAEGLGCVVRRFPRVAPQFALEPARVAAALTPRTRLCVVSNLHNPSGARATDEALREVAAIMQRQGGYLLVDEVYSAMDALGDGEGRFRETARRLHEHILTVSSLTKTHGLGQRRLGWVLAPAHLHENIHNQLVANIGIDGTDHGNVAAFAFAHIGEIRQVALRRQGQRRGIVSQRMRVWRARHSGVDLEWSEPEAGLFGWLRLPGVADLRARIERGARTHDVIAVPGEFFEMPEGVRIAWSLDEQDLDPALDRLEAVLFG
jgi:hypothetical protein